MLFRSNWIIRGETSDALDKLFVKNISTNIEEELIFFHKLSVWELLLFFPVDLVFLFLLSFLAKLILLLCLFFGLGI